jgi:hypothetical protein
MTPPKTRTRHGLNAAMARVKLRGISAIDRRSAAARSYLAFKSQLVTDLGGAENLSAQRLSLVESASLSQLYLSHLDAYLLSLPSLLNRRAKTVIPALLQRQQLESALLRTLSALGLERQQPPPKSITAYLAERAPVAPPTAPPDDDELDDEPETEDGL